MASYRTCDSERALYMYMCFLCFFHQVITLEDQLHTVAMSGDANKVQSLIKDGVNVNILTKVCTFMFD